MKRQQHDRDARARQKGIVSTEFAILLPVFLAIIVGIVEFGHLWYRQHTVTNASREGARAGVVYRVADDGISRLCGSGVAAIATATVNAYLRRFLPDGAWTVQVSNPGQESVTDCSAGADLMVKVTASDNLLVLGLLVPSFQTITVDAETVMKFE